MADLRSMITPFLIGLFLWTSSCSKESVNSNFDDELTYPVNLTVSFDEDSESAHLTWDPVSLAEGYTVWYSYSETSAYTFWQMCQPMNIPTPPLSGILKNIIR